MPILVGLFASLCGFAIYRLFFGSVLGSAAVLIAPFIVVAAGSCHAVQFLRRLFDDSTLQGVSDEDAFVDTFAMRFKPMVISLLADVMAFVVLSFVPFENVSLLGRVTTFGLISVTVAEFFILMPGLYLVMRGRLIRRVAKQKRTKMDGITEAIVRTMVKKRWAHVTVFGVVLVAFIWSAAVVSQLQFSQDNTYAISNALTRSWRNNGSTRWKCIFANILRSVPSSSFGKDQGRRAGERRPGRPPGYGSIRGRHEESSRCCRNLGAA